MKKMIRRVCVWAFSLAFVISLLPMSAFAATVEAKNICGKEAHTHTDKCSAAAGEVVKVLVCDKVYETEGHTHTDDCYGKTRVLNCADEEAPEASHTHGDGCYEKYTLLNCGAGEHTHGTGCYAQQLTCGNEDEGHEHDSACYTEELACGAEEHTHDSGCYTEERKLTCTESDLPGHKHTEGCYVWERGELTCTLEEEAAQPHEHTDACYEEQEAPAQPCGLEEHTHTSACYENKAVINNEVTDKTLQEALKEILNKAEDDEITLILNGQVLDYGYGTGNHAGLNDKGEERADVAILVNGGQTLTIEDTIGGGGIHGNTSDKNLRIIMVTNGTVNLNGGTLSGGKAQGGGAVYVSGNGTLNMSGGSIKQNTAAENGGAVLVEKGGKFEMSGGSIEQNTAAQHGGGVYVGENGQFSMSGGSISSNITDIKNVDGKDEPIGQGGGVAVGANGSFNLSGGSISGNTAGEGGGVFVDRNANRQNGSFTMTGGVIDGNTAKLGEGGGVYIKGEGEITSGAITNNVTETYKDLGGGGIYIEAEGVLTLKNAIITGNTANGMGGGIAACVHGKTYVYALEGAFIAGNTALGQGHSEGHERTDGTYNGSFVDGYTYWADAKDIVKDMAQDIFAAGDAFETANSQGTAGIIVSNNLPGENGGTANWSGYTFSYVTNENGEPVKDSNDNYIFELTEVTEDNNGVVYGNRLVFLTANPDKESVQKAIEAMKGGVIISGNLSANSHGGGIANNGVLTIGEAGDTDTDTVTGMNSSGAETELTKNLESNDENVTIADKTFTFELKDHEGKVIGSVTNNKVNNYKQGTATFNFPPEYFNDVQFPEGEDEVEYVFYVSEKNDGQANVTYDNAQYKVVIKITRTTEVVKLGSKTVTLETLSIGDPEILVAVVDENGNVGYEASPDGIVFNNTYTKPTDPTDPGKPTDPTDPGKPTDPTDPGKPTDPTDPGKPTDPTDPGKPTDPTDPGKPTDPTDPGKPTDPTDPTEPTKPVKPTEPTTPDIPNVDEGRDEPKNDKTPNVPHEDSKIDEPEMEIDEPETPLAEEPEVEIDELEVPLAEEPEVEIEIEDSSIPLADVPRTGDNSHIWAIFAMISGVGLALLALLDKKSKGMAK